MTAVSEQEEFEFRLRAERERAAPARQPSAIKDAAIQLPSGMARGMAGIGDALIGALPQGRAISGIIDAGNAMTGGRPAPVRGAGPTNALSALYERALPAPETRLGRYASAVGEMAPNALAPGGAVRKFVSVVAPGVVGEGAREGASALGGNELVQAGAQFAGNLLGGAAAAVRKVPKLPAKSAPVSPLPSLKAERRAAYKAVEQSGHRYSAEDFAGMVSSVKTRLAKADYDPDFHEPARKMVAKLEGKAARGEAPTLAELDKLRSFARKNVEKVGDPEQRRVGAEIGRGIDDFIDAQGGDASSLVGKARDLYKREKKVQAVEAAQTKAARRAKRTNSGGNYDNSTRADMDRILEKNPYLTADERAALDNLVMGDKGQNALRNFGKMSPSGSALNKWVQLGLAVPTLGLSVGVGAGATVAKKAADNITRTKVQNLIKLMAAGGTRQQLLEAQAQARQIQGPAGSAMRKLIAQRIQEGAILTGTAAASSARARENSENR
jgi:hypothetical protein